MEQKLKYIAYCRKSSEDNTERQALSIPSQIDEIKKRFGHLRNISWIQESKSAFHIGRTNFDAMVDAIKEGKANALLCWHPDRLARNPIDGAIIIDLLDRGLLKELIFCSYTFINNAEGKMMLGIMFTQSKYYSDKLSNDVKRGQAKKLRNGQLPGLAPVGYLNTYNKPKGENEIIPDPERFDLIRKMWDLLLTGAYTVERITKIANEEWNFRTLKRKKIGGKPIGRTSLYDMFSNPFYCGTIRRLGEYYPGSHLQMITPEEYDQAQIILGRKGKPRPKLHTFDFTGLIRCGECEGAVTAEEKEKILKDGTIKHYTYYHCSKRKKGIKCYQKSVAGANVESFILNELDKLVIDDDFLSYAKKYLNELNDKEVKDRGTIYENTEKAYNETQKCLDRLTKAYYRELIDDEEFERQRKGLLAEKNKLKLALDRVDERANQWLKLSLGAFEFTRYAKYWFENGDADRRKAIVNKLGYNFVLKDRIITFELNKVLKIILQGKEKIKKEVARLEPENSYSHSYKTSKMFTRNQLWRDRPDSNRFE